MKDDLIRRQEAIDAIVNTVSDVGLHDNSETARYGATYRQQEILTILESLPSAEPKTEWIPCSEGLPEYRKLVDVTTRDLRVKLAYLDSIKEDGTDELWIIPLEDAECALWNVVAWKPRPEPWKGDK